MEQLKRLTELDQLHFRPGHATFFQWRKSSDDCWMYYEEITWEIAGWMHDSYVARHEELRKAFIERVETWQEKREREHLYHTLTSVCAINVTKERIFAWYLDWKEFVQRLDAPLLEPTSLADQSTATTYKELIGSWPGNETDEELREKLDEEDN